MNAGNQVEAELNLYNSLSRPYKGNVKEEGSYFDLDFFDRNHIISPKSNLKVKKYLEGFIGGKVENGLFSFERLLIESQKYTESFLRRHNTEKNTWLEGHSLFSGDSRALPLHFILALDLLGVWKVKNVTQESIGPTLFEFKALIEKPSRVIYSGLIEKYGLQEKQGTKSKQGLRGRWWKHGAIPTFDESTGLMSLDGRSCEVPFRAINQFAVCQKVFSTSPFGKFIEDRFFVDDFRNKGGKKESPRNVKDAIISLNKRVEESFGISELFEYTGESRRVRIRKEIFE